MRCALLSTGLKVLQKPGLVVQPACAVFPGMLILKLSKVAPFPLQGARGARDWEPLAWALGSCGPRPLGSPSARVPRAGCPGPSLPVRRLMQELGSSTCCPHAGAAAPRGPLLSSLLIFGIRGSREMSVRGTRVGACRVAPSVGELEPHLGALEDAAWKGGAGRPWPPARGPSLGFRPGLLTADVI